MRDRRPHVVLRSIVGPALGLSVSALVAAGAASGCASTQSPDAGPGKPTAQPPPSDGWVGLVATAEPDPEPQPSASTAPSAAPSSIPTGDTVPRPGTMAPPKVGMMPEEPEPEPELRVGTTSKPTPGFRASGRAERSRSSTVRPTRAARRATDADASLLRAGRSPGSGRSLI